MADCCSLPLVRWWKMICSPLISALERDEDFLARVLQSTEADPHLRLDHLEILPPLASDPTPSGSVSRVLVRGRLGKHQDSKQFTRTLVLKRRPERQRLKSNESVVYCNVLPPLWRWVTKEGAVGVCDPCRLLPFTPCLHASPTVTVLEDLTAQGFTRGQLLKGLDLQHSIAAIQALGRFHAVSLSFKQENKEDFDQVLQNVREVVFVTEAAPIFSPSLESALELAIACLKQCPERVISDAVQTLQSLRGRTFRTLVLLVTTNTPLSVICHGDFWINNVMFAYDNKEISNVTLTDLQVVRYSSLATDLLYFLYTSLEPGLLRDYSDDLIKIYHTSLSEAMARLSPTVPSISLEDVLNEVESHALYGLLMSFLVLPNIADSAEGEERLLETHCISPSYSRRIKDIMFEFVDKNFI